MAPVAAHGFRDETGDGIVTHYRVMAGTACLTRDARSATTSVAQVNCKKCLAQVAKMRGAR